MRDLSTDTIDQLVSIEGMITRVSELIPDLRIALFRCSVCHHVEEVRRDGYRVENPERCSNCQTPGSMVIDHNSGYFVDKQLVKMQEVPDQVPEGETPQCVTLFAHEELFEPVKVNRNMSTVRDVFRTFVDVIHYRKQAEGRYCVEGEERDEVSESERRDGQGHEVEADVRKEEEAMKELAKDPEIYAKLTASVAPSIW